MKALILILNFVIGGKSEELLSNKGVITLWATDKYKKEITILNQDNSIYLTLPTTADNTPPVPKDFSPFAIDIPEDILLMEVLEVYEDKYKVSIGRGLYKYIRKSEQNIRYWTWEEFILKYDYVSLLSNELRSPIRESPKGKKLSGLDYESDSITCLKIAGNWLKVKIETPDSSENTIKFGWLKWKEGNKIIIDFRLYD